MTYDSRYDTCAHKNEVLKRLLDVAADIEQRAYKHDASKLEQPELAVFDEYTPKLKDAKYGSAEYVENLAGMNVGLGHHYAKNDHHPEHFTNGIRDMDLVQVIEMLADWKAATLRRADGNLHESVVMNAERFGYGREIETLLLNTAERFGWLSDGK